MTPRAVVLGFLAALAIGGCTESAPTDTGSLPEPTPAASSADATPEASPSAERLVIPRKGAGEVARVVFDDGRVEGRIERRATRGPYLVQASCTATAPEASITYEVRSAEPSRSSQPPYSVGEVACGDSVVDQNSGLFLKGRIQVELLDVDEEVTSAYVVVLPASMP